ncbi:30S ribosomal protein S4 [Candidatus Bathyarchaeota archaeon]|nr:30S ribosomal protein S4 [Candidatus Bathyarchaeota archaeon]
MGDPKRPRRKYETPRHPWSKAQLDAELRLVGEYGLRNKKELRRHQADLSKYWKRARELQALPAEDRMKPQDELLSKMQSQGLIPEGGNIDNVLDLKIGNILDRRLQTCVYRLNLSRTPQQARQLISHGHIAVGNRKVTSPSYITKREEESEVKYAQSSRFSRDDSLIRGPSSAGPENQVSAGPENQVTGEA